MYETAGCEDPENDFEDSDEDKLRKVTVNNVHLTININVDTCDSRCNGNCNDSSSHILITDDNSKDLLNIVQNVLKQNTKM